MDLVKSGGIFIFALLAIIAIFIVWGSYKDNTLAPTPTPSAIVTSNPSGSGGVAPPVRAAFIAIDAAEPGNSVGCGDAIKYAAFEPDTVGVTTVESALGHLFGEAQRINQNGTELYNALANSELQISDIQTGEETIKVYLSGSFMLGGVCDNPRAESQILETIKQNSEASNVEVYVNGKTLDEALSLR